MARDLTGAVLAELSKGEIKLVLFVEVEFASAYVRVWSGVGDINWDSKDWTGAGGLLSVRLAEETSEIRANGAAVTLSGINPAILSAALSEARSGREVNCWLAFLTPAEVIIADPAAVFKGRLDLMFINEGAESATVTVQAESRLIDLNRGKPRRYTHEDQQIDFPGDLGFNHVGELQDWDNQWGGGPPK